MSNILLLDIETSPLVTYSWGVWEQNAIEVIKHSEIICFSAKWLGGEHITRALPDFSRAKDDRELVRYLWKLLDQADIVIAHNGVSFDVKRLNSRFIKYGLLPPSPYKVVDTRRVAKRVFGFPSNSLNSLCAYMGFGEKIDTNFSLWKGCMAGDKQSWAQMKTYNANDVVLLEKLYYAFLPWINNHPPITDGGCGKCGSEHLQRRGLQKTATRTYQRLQCQDCGGWSRSTKSGSTRAVTNA